MEGDGEGGGGVKETSSLSARMDSMVARMDSMAAGKDSREGDMDRI